MRRTSLWAVLAVALAPAQALAEDPPTKPLRASLEVEAEDTDGDGLQERVDTVLGARLRKAEVLPRKTLQDGLIHVEVEPLPGGGYHYDVYAEQGDQTLEQTKTEADCEGCDEAALLDAIGAAVDKCLPPLAAAQATGDASAAEPAAEPPPPKPHLQDPDGTHDRGGRAGPMGKAGIGLMVAGAATAVVGVIFVVQGRSFDTRPGALEQEGVDFRPPGFGLIGVGVASAVTGGILYGVDRKRRRQARISILPGGGATVSVGGRF